MSVRNEMLIAAVNAVRSENSALDVATVAAKLPPDFDVRDDEEFAAALAATNPASKAFDAQEAPQPLPPADAAPLPVAVEPQRAEPLPTLQEADQHAIDLRIGLRRLGDELRIKRGKLAEAITRWQTGGKPLTHEELAREHIASEQAERARRAREGYGSDASAPTPGRSHLDRVASAARGGSTDRGYGNSFRRGGYPVSRRGQKLV